jgi:hypothetical protein
LTGSTFMRQLRLTGADIGGNALVADAMKADSVFLDQEFTAAGAVRPLRNRAGAAQSAPRQPSRRCCRWPRRSPSALAIPRQFEHAE